MRRNLWINLGYGLANLVLVGLLVGPYRVQTVEQAKPPLWREHEEQPLPQTLLELSIVINPALPPLLPAAAALPPPPASARTPVKRAGPVIYRMPTSNRVIALTFDDGPSSRTGKLLALLREHQVPATFFVVGKNVQAKPHLVRALVADGHELANHTWSHPKLTDLSAKEIRRQITQCAAAIKAAGATEVLFMRPPYGSRNQLVIDIARELGYATVLWDVDSRDWQFRDDKVVLERALKNLRPGSIVLFHDCPEVTLRVLPVFIKEVRSQGYEFVLLSDYIR